MNGESTPPFTSCHSVKFRTSVLKVPTSSRLHGTPTELISTSLGGAGS